jgi:GNAT superfamily N-acetyltransferase
LTESKDKRLHGLTPADVVRACEQNYIDYWACAGAPPWGEFSEDGGITRATTGLPNEIFNVVLKCRLSLDRVEEAIDAAIEGFRARRTPLLWHVGMLSEPGDLGRRLEERGFPHDYDLRAMAVGLDELETQADVPEEVRVEVVSDESQSETWIECLASSWHLPREVPDWMSRNPCFNVGIESRNGLVLNRRMYIGLLDDEPVSASMLFWNKGIAGLQAVGTVPSAQNRRVGSATVRAALMDARSMGYSEAMVLSTVEGVRLYEKLGFRIFGNLPEHSMRFD